MFASLFEYKAWANLDLIDALEAINGAAHPDALRDATRILNHTWVVDQIFAANLRQVGHDFSATNTEATPALSVLRAAIVESDNWYLHYLTNLDESALHESLTFTFVDGDRGCMTRAEMLMHLVTHGTYHRGAIGRVLAQRSIAPPRDGFAAFLHRQQPQRRGIAVASAIS